MVGYLTVKAICLLNRHELPQLARPLKPIARYCALRRSRYSGYISERYEAATLEQKAKVIRSLYGFQRYTTSLLELQASKVIAALNRCGIKALVGKNETTTLRMEK